MRIHPADKTLAFVMFMLIAPASCHVAQPAAGPAAAVPQPAGRAADSTNAVEHTPLDDLLNQHVQDGRVDYAGLKNEESRLAAYLDQFAGVRTEQLTRNELLALYLDVYNTATLKLILENYPGITSIQQIPEEQRWKDRRWQVAGKKWTLDELENELLRERFKDPRVHFAMVCASKSCPPLRSEAYKGSEIEAQLDDQVRRFHQDARHFRWDESRRILYLSSIYKWFPQDFGADDKAVIDFVAQYVEPHTAASLLRLRADITIEYLEYDWALNDQ